jgi:hypothetical protein
MDPGYRQSGNWLVGGEPWLRDPAHPGADIPPQPLLFPSQYAVHFKHWMPGPMVANSNSQPPLITSPTLPATSDPHAVSKTEAQSYYAGLPSEPVLLYRTGKDLWSPPRGPEAQRRLKELCEVFTHPIADVWNDDLGWKVVEVMDTHAVS